MKKYPVFLQDDYVSCGAYCIYMILHYYGGYASIHDIKQTARLTRNGITIKGMIECLHTYNIESKAYEANLDDIQSFIHLPCILHVLSGEYMHYVVLYEIKDDGYVIGDPAKGLRKIDREELESIFTHRVIALTHVGRVPNDKKENYVQFLYKTFLVYKNEVIKLIYKGIAIGSFTYLGSMFFKILADEMTINTHYFYMILFSLGYGCVQLTNTYMSYKKNQEVIKLSRALDEDFVYESSISMLNLPYQFFLGDHGYIQSELLSFYELGAMSINIFTRLFLDGITLIFIFLGMCLVSFKMSIVMGIMNIFISLVSYIYYKKIENINKEYIESFYNYQHHLLDLISNTFLIRCFGMKRDIEKESFSLFDKNGELKQQQQTITNHYEHFIHGVIYVFYMAVMLIGFSLFKQSYMTMGEILMFYMLVSYSVEPLLNLIEMFVQYERTSTIYEKYKVFQIEEDKKESFDEKIRSITFENVSYAYGYTLPLFEHLDFVIDKHTLIKGESGCGKTTLLKLIMGYDDHYSGNIYINHYEVRHIDLSSLYRHICYVEGEPTFLHTSLYDNFLYDDREKIIDLLKLFDHEELIDMFHIVLNTEGAPLSLGQRQLVSFIRAILKDADVYIFDEAFSHMDSSLVQKVERHLKKIGEDKIYIEVSHKIKAVKKEWNMITIDKSKKDVV